MGASRSLCISRSCAFRRLRPAKFQGEAYGLGGEGGVEGAVPATEGKLQAGEGSQEPSGFCRARRRS
jgi:hypothetical protein